MEADGLAPEVQGEGGRGRRQFSRAAGRRTGGSGASTRAGRHERLLRARPLRGLQQPRPLRLGALRLLRPGSQGSGQPVRGQPREGLRPRGAPPHHARQLPSVRRRLRQVLLSGAAGAHAHHAATTRAAYREGGLSSSRRWRRRTAFKIGEISDPTEMYLVGHVHHLHQHRRQRRHDRCPSASAPTRACRWACRSSRLAFKDENMFRAAAALGAAATARRPLPPHFADGKVGA